VSSGSTEGTVRLGIKLVQFGEAAASGFDVRAAARPVMTPLADRTGETVFLCVRDGWNAVCIERIDGEMVQSLALKLGGTMPLHLGGAPPVLLAYEDEALWDEYIESQDLVAYTQHSVTKPAEVRKMLSQVRKRGYAISDEDITLGMAAIGAPLFDYKGRVCGALSISGTRPLILGDVAHTTEIVVDAARRITNVLSGDDHLSTRGSS
jgi:DNA-binding IclR family transcriptional regulator